MNDLNKMAEWVANIIFEMVDKNRTTPLNFIEHNYFYPVFGRIDAVVGVCWPCILVDIVKIAEKENINKEQIFEFAQIVTQKLKDLAIDEFEKTWCSLIIDNDRLNIKIDISKMYSDDEVLLDPEKWFQAWAESFNRQSR